MTRAGLFASMAVGVSFMLVVALLSVLFATGANLSVIVPAIRLLAIVVVAALGILALGEPVTWRYTLGASLALAGVYS